MWVKKREPKRRFDKITTSRRRPHRGPTHPTRILVHQRRLADPKPRANTNKKKKPEPHQAQTKPAQHGKRREHKRVTERSEENPKKGAPAVAENDDLEQGPPSRRHRGIPIEGRCRGGRSIGKKPPFLPKSKSENAGDRRRQASTERQETPVKNEDSSKEAPISLSLSLCKNLLFTVMCFQCGGERRFSLYLIEKPANLLTTTTTTIEAKKKRGTASMFIDLPTWYRL